MKLLLPLLLVATSAACGDDDPVTYSDTVDLKLSITSDDVAGNGLAKSKDKNVNTESGNPYGAFVGEAARILGHSPGRILVRGAALALDGGSQNVTALGQIFVGGVSVQFVPNGSKTELAAAGRVFDGSEPAVVDFDPLFDTDDLVAADYDDIIGAAFKVLIVGPAAPTFKGSNASAGLTVSLDFTAYE